MHNQSAWSRWHGVSQIIRFNWRFYLASAVVLAVGSPRCGGFGGGAVV